MTVATFAQPNFTTQDPTQYKGNIDAAMAVFAGVAGQFAPHQQASANMTIVIDPGSLLNGTTLTSKAAQSTGIIAAPSNGTQRIDRVVIDAVTGNMSVITGTQSNSPSASALVTGNYPVAQIALLANSTAITNSMITDERKFVNNTAINASFANSAGIPQYSYSTGHTTLPAEGNGHLLHPTSDNNPRTFTIDSNANVPYPIGTTLTFVNQINVLTIAITSDTLTLAGAGTTGNRTLNSSGMATAIKVEATKWVISGSGLS